MTNLFVFTAASDSAQRHWRGTIQNAIPAELVYQNFPAAQHERLKAIENNRPGFYAWGTTPSKDGLSERFWERMEPGDHVLGTFKKHYRCAATVLEKFDNRAAAESFWGVDPDTGETWRYLYFLSQPTMVTRHYDEVDDFLPSGFRRFIRIGDVSTRRIDQSFGSIENFVKSRIIEPGRRETGIVLSEFLDADETAPDPAHVPAQPTVVQQIEEYEKLLDREGQFDVTDETDARDKTLRMIVARRGQPQFRRSLLVAYGGRCAVTGFDCEAALEAAHIVPYKGEHTNDVRNGLLLRSDIHSLFDCGLLGVDPRSMTIILSEELRKTRYEYLRGKDLHLPSESRVRPDVGALAAHLEASRLA